MKKHFLIALCALMAGGVYAQRTTDKLDRGLVAVKQASGNFLSWRIFGEEYYDVTYNLYCDGTLLKENLKTSNYSHTAGNASSQYQVAAVVRGVEQEKCSVVTPWTTQDGNANYYWPIKMQPVVSRKTGLDITSMYTINDVSLGDLTGDGKSEFIVKRIGDDWTVANDSAYNWFEAYKMDGTRLWYVDMGPNNVCTSSVEQNMVCYDWDGDGRAEVLFKTGDGAIIHDAYGNTHVIGSLTVNTRYSGITYTHDGAEYLVYMDGETGVPYPIGANDAEYMTYPLTRGDVNDWGDGYGHRSTKYFFGAPFLDGRHASIFLGRGIYTRHKMIAYDVDPATHKLTQRWYWENTNSSSPWFGQGYHNYAIADVDWDGRDEIVYGSMVIDDNGKGLHTTGLGHGDAQHCADLDPYRHGQEQFACNETSPCNNYRDATTGEILYRLAGTNDDGRSMAGNFSNTYPGCIAASSQSGVISCTSAKIINGYTNNWNISNANPAALNFRIYWDGDLQEETVNSPGTERECVVLKDGGRLFQTGGVGMINWTKNNPCAQGDILGDWREELVLRSSDNTELRIYITTSITSYRNYTLWHDHQYRNAMVWQMCGYNQPPHASYFLGELEGITMAPPPLTLTGRTEIPNGGTITTSDEHLIVCETNNTEITIQDGAAPYLLTFNVPTWVQGSAASNTTTKNTAITTETYTCNVTGGALTGNMRLVKQGDGILNLPTVDMTYTGATNVWAGTLNFDGSLKNSSLWLNRFAELNSKGTFRSIKADYAAVIRPGGADTKGEITVDSLTLGFGSRLQLDLYSDGLACDRIHTKYIKVEAKSGTIWETYGPEYITPVLEVVAHKADGETMLATGDYVLGDADVVSGDLSKVKIEGISGQKTKLHVEDGKLILTIEGVRDAATVYWTGSDDTTWDYADATNFQNVEGDKDIFVSGDKVVFDDAASSFTVSLTGSLDPDTVFVNTAKAYSFTGTGVLTGNAALVKKGTGTLTIANDNVYEGGTTISEGVVRVSSLSNQYQAYGNLGAVTTNTKKNIIENGATLQTTAAVEMGSPIRLQGDEGGILNNSANFIMDAAFLGTQLTKTGTGWLKLYANNTALDKLVVAAGTVDSYVDTSAKTIELQGGTMNLNNGSSVAVTSVKGKTSVLNCYADRGTYSFALSGEGTVTISYPTVVGSTWYATRANFSGNWSAFTGTVKPVAVQSGDGRFCLNNSNGLPKGKMELASGVELQNTAKNFAIGEVTGQGTLGGTCSLSSSATSGNNTWTIGDDGNFTFAGKITGASAFVKQGSGKMTFTGSGDFTGTAKVSAGELCLNSSATTSMLGTGTLNVSKGATLSGKGVLNNSSITVASGAVLRSGITETSATGNLQFGGKDVTVNGTIKTYVNTRTTYSKFSNIGTLKLNGTLIVGGRDGLALSEGTELQIFDASTITLGSALTLELCEPNVSLGLTWDTSRLSEGILVVGPAPDSVGSIRSADLDKAEIYTLQGVRLSQKPTRAGIYIVNGVKTLLK